MTDALQHITEAYRLLTGEVYRGTDASSMVAVDGVCTLVMDLERIDGALGPRGESIFGRMADQISAVYTEIKAAKAAMEKPHD